MKLTSVSAAAVLPTRRVAGSSCPWATQLDLSQQILGKWEVDLNNHLKAMIFDTIYDTFMISQRDIAKCGYFSSLVSLHLNSDCLTR